MIPKSTIQTLENFLQQTTAKTAADFHQEVVVALEKIGYFCEREFILTYGINHKAGRIDILAQKSGSVLAIECDAAKPRLKSIKKLKEFVCDKIILLRITKRLLILPNSKGAKMKHRIINSLLAATFMLISFFAQGCIQGGDKRYFEWKPTEAEKEEIYEKTAEKMIEQ